MNYYYAFSFTDKEVPLPYRYELLMNELKQVYPRAHWQYHYEEGKRKILHIHGMVASPMKLYMNRFRNKYSEQWDFDFGFVKSKLAWTAYSTKHKNREDMVLAKWLKEEREFFKEEDPQDSEEYIEISQLEHELSINRDLEDRLRRVRIV